MITDLDEDFRGLYHYKNNFLHSFKVSENVTNAIRKLLKTFFEALRGFLAKILDHIFSM